MCALRNTIRSAVAIASFALTAAGSAQTSAPVNVTVDARAATTPFPHFWEQIFGSCQPILSLRQSFRDDLRTVKHVPAFDAVVFHGTFLCDLGLCDRTATTKNTTQSAQP